MDTNQPQRLEPNCGARHPAEPWLRCTLPEGHQGDHIAEVLAAAREVRTWPQDGGPS